MPENPEERKQWHPVVIDGLRYLFGSKVEINPELGLADLPTQVDAMAVQRTMAEEMPFPYNHFGATTLVELATPGKWATWRHLRRMHRDWVDYSLVKDREEMPDVSLWLIASRMSRVFRARVERSFPGLEPLAPGVWRTSCFGSPLILVSLHEIGLTVETLPLTMAYRGSREREREIASLVLQHGREHMFFYEQAVAFHSRALREVLAMKGMNVEAYRRLANVRDVIDFFSQEYIVENLDEDRVIKKIGEDRVIDDLIRQLGPEGFQALVAERLKEHGKNGRTGQAPLSE